MKKTELTIKEDKARQLYKTASPELKELLEETFGKDNLNPDLKSKVTSVEAACKLIGKKREEWIPYANPKNDWEEALNATADLWLIAEALREKKIPDYDNADQKKWSPYFEKKKSGFGFANSFCGYTYSFTGSGALLSVFTEDLAQHFGTHPPFLALHNKVLTIKKD